MSSFQPYCSTSGALLEGFTDRKTGFFSPKSYTFKFLRSALIGLYFSVQLQLFPFISCGSLCFLTVRRPGRDGLSVPLSTGFAVRMVPLWESLLFFLLFQIRVWVSAPLSFIRATSLWTPVLSSVVPFLLSLFEIEFSLGLRFVTVGIVLGL